jgi:flagellar hook-associated protein FlgK
MGISALDSALTGIRVAQQQMDVLTNNIANVNTEGYTRKTLPQEALTADGVTVGVKARVAIRDVNLDLARDLWTQISSTNFYDVQANYLQKIQEFHGPPDAEISISATLADLRDNFLNLATSPDDLFAQQTTVSEAENLANKINDFASLITQLRNDAQDQIDVTINKLNGLFEQIADLNVQIKVNNAAGKTSASLEDLRDVAVKEVAQELEVSFFVKGDGILVLNTTGGVELVSERAETLFFGPSPIGPSSFFTENDPSSSAAGIFTVGNPDIESTAVDITDSALNGNIGGLLALRDEILPQHMAQIDELAHELAVRFDTQGLKLFTDSSGLIPSSVLTDITSSDLVSLAGAGGLSTAAGAPYVAGVNDRFTITFDPNSSAPRVLNIDLSLAEANFPPPSANSLRDELRSQISQLPIPYNQTSVDINANGELVINSLFDVEILANGAGEMGPTGLAFLGLPQGVTEAEPSSSNITPYVGFASEIRVNRAILDDATLIQNGTLPGLTVQNGSSEFIRRVTNFVFGDIQRQELIGSIDLNISAIPDTLQNVFGLNPQALLISDVDLFTLGQAGTLSTAAGNPFEEPTSPPLLDSFSLRFDPGGANDTGYIEINLTAAEAFSPLVNGADQLVDYINNSIIPALGAPLSGQIVASLNPFGQLVIDSQVDIEVDDGVATTLQGMGDAGLSFLGLNEGTINRTLPSFDIQVGADNPVTITIEPGDTEIELLTKLNAVPGVIASLDPTTGSLNIRPGISTEANGGYGGDIRIVAGSVLSATDTTVIEELFGVPDPVIDISHNAFHENNLGPAGNLTSDMFNIPSLIDFAEKMISTQSEAAIFANSRAEDERSFRDVLSRQFLDETAVNLDEEMSFLILTQTAFSAAARAIQAVEELFDELFDAFR